jgi:glycosyltransferase involved in cell wall biosynthesis
MPNVLLERAPLNPSHAPLNVREILGPTTPAAKRTHKIIAVLPAYNAEKTLAATIADVPPGSVDEILLVDDGSKDRTVELAREMGLTVIVHTKNRGYGGNQKTCYKYALDNGYDIVVMIHPDYQYDARVIPHAVSFIELGIADVVLGNRIRSRPEAIECGMPWWKYVCNRALTLFENLALGQNLGEFHSGFRVYRRQVLETLPFEENSEDFVFDTQFLVQAVRFGFRLSDVPVPVRYFREASSINFRRSTKYGLETVKTVMHYWAWKCGLPSKLFRGKNRVKER